MSLNEQQDWFLYQHATALLGHAHDLLADVGVYLGNGLLSHITISLSDAEIADLRAAFDLVQASHVEVIAILEQRESPIPSCIRWPNTLRWYEPFRKPMLRYVWYCPECKCANASSVDPIKRNDPFWCLNCDAQFNSRPAA